MASFLFHPLNNTTKCTNLQKNNTVDQVVLFFGRKFITRRICKDSAKTLHIPACLHWLILAFCSKLEEEEEKEKEKKKKTLDGSLSACQTLDGSVCPSSLIGGGVLPVWQLVSPPESQRCLQQAGKQLSIHPFIHPSEPPISQNQRGVRTRPPRHIPQKTAPARKQARR